MPDVGVLSLQIQDNSEKAISGLDKLVDALTRVKTAVNSGLKLVPIATGIEKLGKAVDEHISGSTIVKIGQLADELSKLKDIGNITIKVTGAGTASAVTETVKKAQESATGGNTGFEEIGERTAAAKSEMDEYTESVNAAAEATREMNGGSFAGIVENNGEISQAQQKINEYTVMLERAKSDLEDATAALAEYKQNFADTGEDRWTERIETANRCIEVAERKVQDYTEAIRKLQEQMDNGTVSVVPATNDQSVKDITETAKAASEATTAMAETVVQAVAKADASEEESVRKFVQRLEEVKEASAEAAAIREQQLSAFYGTPEPVSLDQTNAMADNLTQLDLLTAQLREAEQKYNDLVNSLGAGDSKTIKAGLAVSNLRDKIWALQNSSSETTSSLKNLDNELREKKTDSDEASEGMRSFCESIHELRAGIGRLFPHLTNLAHRFRSMIVMRSLRYVIRQIAAGFREGVENVYHYSKAVGTSLAPAMDQAATSLQLMRNSIGAAMAPVIQALVPVLQNVANWFINLINYANQFFALLNGQKTWTRALPQQAQAFEDSAKSAKKAGSAMKDLLADWDELNIIQSQSGGGGGSGTAKTAAEYAQMFEEVNEFDNGVKDTLAFIEEHLGGLSEILRKAGLILLGWRFSRAFTGLLGLLGRLVAGGALISIGFDLTYGAAFDAGSKGYFDTQDIIRSVIGGLAMALGGSLITVGLGLGGVLGFGIGLMAAAIVTIVGYCNGEQDLWDRNKWGNLTWTQEQIEKFVREQFTFDVDAEIDVMNAHISDTEKAKEAVRTAVNKFSESLAEAEKIVADVDTTDAQKKVAAVKAAAEDAQAAIKAVQELIDTNEKGLKFTLTNFKFTDEEGNDITASIMETITVADSTLREYFTDIGQKLAELILEGEKSGWKNGEMEAALELMASQKRIYERAEELQNRMKFEIEMSAGLNGVIDRDTAQKVFEEQKQRLAEYEETVKQTVQTQADTLTELAALAESAAIEAGYDPETGLGPEAAMKLHQASEDYKTQAEAILTDLQGAIDDKLKDTKEKMAEDWKEVLLAVYGQDMIEKASGIFDMGGSWFDWLDRIFGVSTASDAVIERWIQESGYEGAGQKMYEALKASMESVDPNGIVTFLLDELKLPLKDFLTDDMLNMIASNIVKNTNNKGEAYELFKNMLGLDPEEAKKYIDPMYQDIFSDIGPVESDVQVNANPVVQNDPLQDIKDEIVQDFEEEYIDLDAEARITIDPIIPIQAVEDAVEEAETVMNSLNIDPNAELSRDAQHFVEMIQNAINSGLGMDEISAAHDQALEMFGLDAWMEALPYIEKMMDEYRKLLEDNEPILGKTGVPKGIGTIARVGMSDTGYNTQPIYTQPAIQTEEQMSNSVEKGVKNANADQNDLIRELITLATRIANKQWTVNVTPNSSWGQHNARSQEAYDRVRG